MCHQRRCLRSRRPCRGAATQRRLGAPRAARRSRSRRASGRAREARPRARWCWSVRRLATRRAPPSPRPSARGRRERRSAWDCRASGATSRCLRIRVGAWAMRGATRRGTGGLASATDAAARRRRRRSPSRAGTTTARREPLASGLGKQPRMQRAARQGGLASPPSEPSHCPWGVDATSTERSANILAHCSRGCLPLSSLLLLLLPLLGILLDQRLAHGISWSTRPVRRLMCDLGHRLCPRSARPTPALVSATRAPCDSLLCPVPVRRSAGLACPSAGRSIFTGAAR